MPMRSKKWLSGSEYIILGICSCLVAGATISVYGIVWGVVAGLSLFGATVAIRWAEAYGNQVQMAASGSELVDDKGREGEKEIPDPPPPELRSRNSLLAERRAA